MKKDNKIISLVILVMVFFGYYFLNVKYRFTIPCIFHKLTGLYCPGCGITRMLFSLIQLNIYQAFRYNSFVFCLFLLFLLYKGSCLFVKRKWNYEIKINSNVYIVLLILAICFGVLRNLPSFDYLKPTLIK